VTGRRVLAAADVGSNTVHALAAAVEDERLEDLASYLEMPELGAAVDRTGRIGPEKTAEAIAALRSVLDRSRAHGPEHVVVGATAAVRRAADGEEFLAAASAAAGTPVRLIGEEREAQLSFLGVASRHGTTQPWLMGDMGGASTELVAAEGRRMLRWVSLRAGSGALADRYLSDPPRPGEREALRRAALAEVRRAPECEAGRLVMTGGTASYLPLVLSVEQPPPVLATEQLLTAVERLDAAPAATLAGRLGVPAARVRALRAGAELLLLLLDFYGLDRFHVSHAGLRQGMILAWLERGDDWWR
jgi:exopolyphosphatase / guanosine-5'-triphosphate,3'-diphosphate pyrophosphatase